MESESVHGKSDLLAGVELNRDRVFERFEYTVKVTWFLRSNWPISCWVWRKRFHFYVICFAAWCVASAGILMSLCYAFDCTNWNSAAFRRTTRMKLYRPLHAVRYVAPLHKGHIMTVDYMTSLHRLYMYIYTSWTTPISKFCVALHIFVLGERR